MQEPAHEPGERCRASREPRVPRTGRCSRQAGLATPELVDLLDVALLSPILRCTGITHTTDGRVIDYARIHYRGDRFTYAVALRAD